MSTQNAQKARLNSAMALRMSIGDSIDENTKKEKQSLEYLP